MQTHQVTSPVVLLCGEVIKRLVARYFQKNYRESYIFILQRLLFYVIINGIEACFGETILGAKKKIRVSVGLKGNRKGE